MTKYSGKLRSKDEELSCECEGVELERKLSDYQKHMMKCMLGFIPRGHSVADNKRIMQEKFKACASAWRK